MAINSPQWLPVSVSSMTQDAPVSIRSVTIRHRFESKLRLPGIIITSVLSQ